MKFKKKFSLYSQLYPLDHIHLKKRKNDESEMDQFNVSYATSAKKEKKSPQ